MLGAGSRLVAPAGATAYEGKLESCDDENAAWAQGLASTPVGLAVTTLAGSVLHRNEAFLSLLRDNPNALDQESAADVADVRVISRGLIDETILEAAMRTGQHQTLICVPLASGAVRKLLCCVSRAMHNATPIYLSLVLQDVSELVESHRQQLAALRSQTLSDASEDDPMLARLLDVADVAICLVDRKLRYQYFNRAYSDLVGSFEGVLPHKGGSVLESIAARRRSVAAMLSRAFKGEKLAREEALPCNLTGASRWFDFSFSPMPDAQGQIKLVMVHCKETSVLRRVNQRHEFLKQEIKQRVDQRTARIRVAGEELCTLVESLSSGLLARLKALNATLSGVQSWADGRCEGWASSGNAVEELLCDARTLATRAQAELADLTELSSIGAHAPSFETVDMNALIQGVQHDLSFMMAGRKLEMDVERLPPLHADRRLIRQAFTRVLSNALIFTARRKLARVRIWTARRKDAVVWSIADNGEGFAMSDARHIFAPFVTLHPGFNEEGRGIGLCVAKRAVEHMGGRIWCEGHPGQGAAFHFTFARPATVAE